MKKDKEIIASYLTASLQCEDPVEEHICKEVIKLKIQNDRYKSHIDKTASWIHIKDIKGWKAFDFYHYFCYKFREKYKKEFRLTGSIARAYNRIESFVKSNGIETQAYKDFIDLAFSRYFNMVITPELGNIVSSGLYEKLMGKKAKLTKVEDLFELDQLIEEESKQFQEEIRNGEGIADLSDFD